MKIDEDEVHEIVETAWNDLIDSIRMKRHLDEIIMDNDNALEILRLHYFYAAAWTAISD